MHGGREPGDFDYLWAGKKGTTMIKGAIFDMDGTLVDNTPVHIRAFEIFCERYGIRDWKEKLGQAYGMGNDDIMKLIMPAEVIREKGLAALAEVRGSHRVTSQNPEEQYQSLEKYGRDLTEAARRG